MADPVELQIVEAVRERLERITVANGFHTDAGERVLLGRVIDAEHDDLPVLVVWLPDPLPTTRAPSPGLIPRTLPVTVEAVFVPDDDDPLADAIKIARDIKAAVYRIDDLRLLDDDAGDLSITSDEYFPAEPGMRGASVQVSFSVPYFERFEKFIPPTAPPPEP